MFPSSKIAWRHQRRSYLQAARECRRTLIDQRGYAPADARLRHAAQFWVNRARRAHAIAMGREAITDFLFISEGGSSRGKIYAE